MQLKKMQATMGQMSAKDVSTIRFGDPSMGSQGLLQRMKATEAFRIDSIKALSATESLTNAIRKQDLTVGQLIKNRGKLNDVLKEQWRLQNASAMGWSQDARGRISADMFIPRDVPARIGSFRDSLAAAKAGQISFGQALMEGRMKVGVYSQALQSAALNTVNWGKNMQWAGRQLMVGLTLPFAAFGVVAAMSAKTVDKELTRIQKVYDYTSATIRKNADGSAVTEIQRTAMLEAEAFEVRSDSMKTATQSAALYGSKMEDTLKITGELAAAGKNGVELQATTNLVNRAALLGELDREDALKATITLQNVYGMSIRQLGDSFNYMNALENSTSLSMQDMVIAIPRLSGVVKSLGGDLQDIGTLMTAAKVGGIDAAEAANALKSVLFRANAPSGGPNEKTFIEATGTSLKELREQAGGDGIRLITEIGKKMEAIPDPAKRISILREVFGIYQGSKAGIIMEQLAKNTEQVAKANEVAALSTNAWANTADKEVEAIAKSISGRFDIAVQSMRASLADLGDPFLEAGIVIVNAIGGILDFINKIPAGVKKFAFIGLAMGALIGPVVMLTGLLANFFGTIVKAGATFSLVASRFRTLSQDEAGAALAAKMGTLAFTNQTTSALALSNQISMLSQEFAKLHAMQVKASTAPAIVRPLGNMTSGNTIPVSQQAAAAAYAATGKTRLYYEDAIIRKVQTEQQMHVAVTQEMAKANTWLIQKNALQAKFDAGKISEISLARGLMANDIAHNRVLQYRDRMQAKLNGNLITEQKAKQNVARLEAAILAQVEKRVAAERQAAFIAAGGQRGRARREGERVGAAAGAGVGGGAVTGIAMVGMMAGSMGVLNSGTSKWVSTIAMSIFMFSTLLVAAKAVQGAIAGTAVVQAALAARTAAATTGMIGLTAATRAFAAATWASLAPWIAIAAPIAIVAAGLLYAYKSTKDLRKEMEDWSSTSERTASQVGVSLADGFTVAAGEAGKTAKEVGKVLTAEEKWRKENRKSYEIINGGGRAAEVEVQRIGIDIFQATGDAKKAKEAMELAINGSNQKGLKVNLDLDMSNIQSQMQQASAALLSDIQNDRRGFAEGVLDDLKTFDFTTGAGMDSLDALGLGEEAQGKAREMGAQLAEAYIGGNLDMFNARAESTRSAITSQMIAMMDTNDVMETIKNNAGDQDIIKQAGFNPENAASVAKFFLQYDTHGKKVNRLSSNLREQGKTSAALRLTEEEMVKTLVSSGVLKEGEASKTNDLSLAQKAMADALGITTREYEANKQAQEENVGAMGLTEEGLKNIIEAQKQIMTSSWGSVMGNLDDQVSEQFAAEIDGIEKNSQGRLDAIDQKAKNRSKDFDRQGKAMDEAYKKRERSLKDTQDARRKSEEKMYDDRISQVEKQMDAEKKAEENRQKMFEAERTRVQRLTEMFNQNIDFNVALNSGNMDEAAKIANNMRSSNEGWALDDAGVNAEDANAARQEQLEKQKEGIEGQKELRMNVLDDQDEREKEFLDKQKERDKEALDSVKERYQMDVESQKKAEQAKTESTKKATQERQKLTKLQLDADIAALRAYIPKSEADLRAHIGKLEAAYGAHDITIDTKSKQWSASINAYIKTATDTQKQTLANEADWAEIGAKAGDALTQGMLGMTLDDFNAWAMGGMVTTPQYKGVDQTKQENFKVPGGTILKHGGGLAEAPSSGRAGRSMSAGLFRDEIPHILQRGEYVVDKGTTSKYGAGFFKGLQDGRMPETGDNYSGGLMGGAGKKIMDTWRSAMSIMVPKVAMAKAQQQMAAGQANLIPSEITRLLASNTTAAAAGKYGDASFDDQQLANAASIMSVGKGMGATDRDLVIALMTAMQESTLRNIPGGDRDSLGLFQQRPSQGWGSIEQIMNPQYSSRKFFEGLFNVKGRDTMPLTQAAQSVQRSAFPGAYAKWENEARGIIAASGMGAIGQSMLPPGVIGGRGGRGVSSIMDIIGIINGSGVPFRATSTSRPGAITAGGGNLSYHATDNAVDFGAAVPGKDSPGLLAINRYFAKFGKGLKELIYSGPGGINMNNGSPHTYNGITRANHHDHVHVAATKDSLANIQMPSMRVGGEVQFDNTIANLHKKETVLTAPLSEGLKRGIRNLDQNGGSEYNITMDMRGSTIDSNFDMDAALDKAISKRESKLGRNRKIK